MDNFLEMNVKIKRYKIEEEQDWRGEMGSMPFIRFPADWEIQIIPPFGDAVVRFRVKLPSGLEKSIYLDSRCSLGVSFDADLIPLPYWEVYPVAGDIMRCDKSDIKTLLESIADETSGE